MEKNLQADNLQEDTTLMYFHTLDDSGTFKVKHSSQNRTAYHVNWTSLKLIIKILQRQELHYLKWKSSNPSLPLGALGKVNTFKIPFGARSTCSLPQFL